MRDPRTKSSGFTLLELILVMGILTLVVGMIAPSLTRFSMGRGKYDAADIIVSLATYARAQAANDGQTYRLNFDPAGRAVWLTVMTGATFAPPPNDYGERYDMPKGVTFQCDVTPQPDGKYVTFLPTGRTQQAHIRVTDNMGSSVDVGCLSSTELFHVLAPGEQ